MTRWIAMVALLAGCGARPAAPPVPDAGGITWTDNVGGAWVATCAHEDGFIALRAGGLDRWTVPEAGPLVPKKSLDLAWPADEGPGKSMSCGKDRLIFRHDGMALLLEGETLTPTGGMGLIPGPVAENSLTINGRALRLTRGGWALVRNGAEVESRPVPGDFADATWDGETLWAVGPTGLWRWSPKRPRWVLVPLPGGLRVSLMRVWRDGPFIWVVDEARIGRALNVHEGLPTLARRPGPVRLTGPERMALVGGTQVSVTLRGDTLTVGGTVVQLDGRVGAFTPIGGSEVLLGVGNAIERWWVAGTPRRVARWVVGDATRRIIVTDDRVFAVGGYGLLLGAVTGLTPPPADRPAAGPSAPPFPAGAPKSGSR